MVSYSVNLRFEDSGMLTYWKNLVRTTTEMWNFCSPLVLEHKAFNIVAAHNVCYDRLRKRFPEIPAQICIKTYKSVITAYTGYRKREKKLPDKPFVRKNSSLRMDKCLYSRLTGTGIKLSSGRPNKRLNVEFDLYPKFTKLAGKYPMKDPLIVLKDNELKLVVPFDVPKRPVTTETYLGVDLGIRRLATTSDGTAYTDKTYLKNRRRIRHNKRIFQSRAKTSNSAKRKFASLRNKEVNVSKNLCHHLANKLLKTDKTVLVLEDLTKIKKNTSKTRDGHLRKRHNNALSQVPFYQIKTILSYKAPLVGKRVETVSPYNTSQMDCRNGKTAGCTRRGCRFYAADGRVFDADWNAAVNIKNILQHERPISFKPPLDGKLNLVGRVCQPPNRGSFSTNCKPTTL